MLTQQSQSQNEVPAQSAASIASHSGVDLDQVAAIVEQNMQRYLTCLVRSLVREFMVDRLPDTLDPARWLAMIHEARELERRAHELNEAARNEEMERGDPVRVTPRLRLLQALHFSNCTRSSSGPLNTRMAPASSVVDAGRLRHSPKTTYVELHMTTLTLTRPLCHPAHPLGGHTVMRRLVLVVLGAHTCLRLYRHLSTQTDETERSLNGVPLKVLIAPIFP